MDEVTALRERLRRTRAVCLALERADGDPGDRRVGVATSDLWRWLRERYPAEMGTRSRGGLDAMPVPPGCAALVRELYAAAAVADSVGVYDSADTFAEMEQDAVEVRTCLAEWRAVADQTADETSGESADADTEPRP